MAKGPREALATIWNDYLAEVLQVSPKSERYKIMRREIEAAAGFKEVYENWNTLSPESRAVAWRRLMTASRNHLLERGERCVRCGKCCEKGSPTLLIGDLGLFQREVLTLKDVYILRPGEKATNREGEVTALAAERLKVRRSREPASAGFTWRPISPAGFVASQLCTSKSFVSDCRQRARPSR